MTSKRGKKYCSVFGCLNNDFANPDLSFFILPSPTQPEIRLQWLRLIDREDLSNKSKHNERICEVHFKAEDISMNSQRKRLKKNCLPCLRLPKNKEDKGTHVEITSVTTSTQIDLPSCSSSCQLPIDSKREEFRRYLERAGVMDALTKVLVSLYEEPDKPEDALEYVRKHLGTDGGDDELEAARARIAELEAENALLKGEAAPTEG